MKCKTLSRITAAIAFAGVITGSGAVSANSSGIYNIGTGGLGGILWPTGGKICDLMNKSRNEGDHDFRCVVESTGGTISNIRGIKSGDFDLGLGQADLLYFAVTGENRFEADGPDENLRFVMSFNHNMLHVMVRADSGIDSIADLAGKRVNTGNVGSGTEATSNLVLPYYGIDPQEDLALNSKLTMKEQGQAICDGKIDAFLQPTALSFAVGLETSNTCDVNVVPVSGEPLETLLKEHPYYSKTQIPGGVYEGTDVDVDTFGYPVVLMTREDVSEEFVYQLVKSVFNNYEEFKAQHPAYQSMTRDASVSAGAMAPYHEGAERYFKEIGLLE